MSQSIVTGRISFHTAREERHRKTGQHTNFNMRFRIRCILLAELEGGHVIIIIKMLHEESPEESQVPDQKQNQDQRVIKDRPRVLHDCNSNEKETGNVEDAGN